MNNEFNKWFWMIVVFYFLGLVAFFFVGLGKITSLMFPDTLESIRKGAEFLSWVATTFAFSAAAITYWSNVRQNKKLAAKDALESLKNNLSDLNEIIDRRWEVLDSFSKFENRVSDLAAHEANELIDALSSFCKSLLVKIKVHHIFPVGIGDYINGQTAIFKVTNDGKVVNFDKDVDGIQKTLDATAKLLFKKNIVHDLQGNFFLKTDESAYGVLSKIASYAQPDLFNHYLVDKKSGMGLRKVEFSEGDKFAVFQSFEYIPAAIFYLNFAHGRHRLFNEVKELLKFEAS